MTREGIPLMGFEERSVGKRGLTLQSIRGGWVSDLSNELVE